MENFTMKDIHSGYVIELRNGHNLLAMRVHQHNFTKIFIYEERVDWFYASYWDENTLKYKGQSAVKDLKDFDIVKVYGLISASSEYYNANTTNLDGRPLLWQRKKPKNIKTSQIRKLLGITNDEEMFIEVDD